MRSNARKVILRDMNATSKVFTDQKGQPSFKKVVDTHELSKLLVQKGNSLDDVTKENLGSILLCFG